MQESPFTNALWYNVNTRWDLQSEMPAWWPLHVENINPHINPHTSADLTLATWGQDLPWSFVSLLFPYSLYRRMKRLSYHKIDINSATA